MLRKNWFPSTSLICVSAFAVPFVSFHAMANKTKPSGVPAAGSASAAQAAEEKPPLVLQNRYFLKALRPEVSLFGGSIMNESYSQTWLGGARAGIFFTETIGAEYSYTSYFSSDSADLKALKKLEYCNDKKTRCTSPEPSFNRLTQSQQLALTFAPIYGKVNFLDLSIVYSDIYANLGASFMGSQQGNKVGGLVGVGQRFYFAKSYNVRIDATDYIFMEERENLGNKSKALRNALVLSLGFSAFLWE
jgi:outer membrane beta-barrel protein